MDFEIATAVDTERTAVLGAPGFMDLSLTSARDCDLYALAAASFPQSCRSPAWYSALQRSSAT